MKPEISIIIPVANEANALPKCLGPIKGAPNEIIVVDAGSEDGTAAVAAAAGACIIAHPERHRARQMNYGAAAARGRVLLFLHADTLLPPGALVRLLAATDRPGVVGGAFSRRYCSSSVVLAVTTRLASLRNRSLGWHLGDQALFVRREVFEKLGGYRDLAVFEDLDFSRRLRRIGKTVTLTPPVYSSARRFAQHGPLRTTWHDLLLTYRYLSGKDLNDSTQADCQAQSDGLKPLQTYEHLS